jgi:hypothetical protein
MGFDVAAMYIETLSWRKGLPVLVGGQWRCDHHGDLVARLVVLRKVDAQVFVANLGVGEGVAALDIVQLCGRMGPQRQAIAQQEIEGAVLGQSRRQFAQGQAQLVDPRHARIAGWTSTK